MKTSNFVKLGKPALLPKVLLAVVAATVAAASMWIVNLSQQQRYWVVNTDAPLGAQLSTLELSQVSASLTQNQAGYLKSSSRPEGYLSRSVKAGELLSESSISQLPVGSFARVVISSSSVLSSSVVSGGEVEVWIAPRLGSEFGLASQVVEAAQVVRRVDSEGMFNAQQQLVELQLELENLPAVLDAMASESAIYLVPKS